MPWRPDQARTSAPDPPLADAAAAKAPKVIDEPSVPNDARRISEREKKADLSSLGGDVAMQLVEQLAPDTGDAARKFDLELIVSGAGSAIVDLGDVWDVVSPEGTAKPLRAVAALSPPRPFDKADAPKLLPFQGALLYFKRWKSGNLAVGRDGDAIVVWRIDIVTEEEEYISDWYEQTRLTLAPGAQLAAK